MTVTIAEKCTAWKHIILTKCVPQEFADNIMPSLLILSPTVFDGAITRGLWSLDDLLSFHPHRLTLSWISLGEISRVFLIENIMCTPCEESNNKSYLCRCFVYKRISADPDSATNVPHNILSSPHFQLPIICCYVRVASKINGLIHVVVVHRGLKREKISGGLMSPKQF